MRPKRRKHKAKEPHNSLDANPESSGTRQSSKAHRARQGSLGWGRPGQHAGQPFSRQIDADLTEAVAAENPDAHAVSTEFTGADFPEVDTQAESAKSPMMTFAAVRERAVRLLVNREHGRLELEQKLQQRELPPDLIVSVLDQLAEEGLQCDSRFAESYTRMRVDRGYGANKVRADLQTRRLDQSVIEDAIRDSGVDWCGVAAAALAKKFGNLSAADVKTRSKMQRYLYQRGFSMDEIRFAIDGHEITDPSY